MKDLSKGTKLFVCFVVAVWVILLLLGGQLLEAQQKPDVDSSDVNAGELFGCALKKYLPGVRVALSKEAGRVMLLCSTLSCLVMFFWVGLLDDENSKVVRWDFKKHLQRLSVSKETKYLMLLITAFGSLILYLGNLLVEGQDKRDANQEAMIQALGNRVNLLADTLAQDRTVLVKIEELNRRVEEFDKYRQEHSDISNQTLQRLAAIEALLKYQFSQK